MKRSSTLTAVLMIAAIMATFSAYSVINSLMRDFHEDVTVIDLGVLFILGLITGIAVGIGLMARNRRSGPG